MMSQLVDLKTPLAAFSLSDPNFTKAAYIVAVILFVLGLRRLSHPTTARSGNIVAAIGMAIAILATLFSRGVTGVWLIILGIVIGTVIGVPAARSVKMTAMPQMVALFNGVGGGAAALIAWADFRRLAEAATPLPVDTAIAIAFSTVVGAVSFWGSLIAFGKLQEVIQGRPVIVTGQRVANLVMVGFILAGCVLIVATAPSEGVFIALLCLSSLLGVAMVLPIGGADMPVVISMLNAFTGLAAAATGFALQNTVLIVAGTLVGASGTILTRLMSKAMNRSLGNVLFAGFGAAAPATAAAETDGNIRSTTAQDAAIQLAYARRVVVVPGYGLAVAQAQHAVRELAQELEKHGVEVSYAIHPVAGRMPGHMNVLLAEADVPYDQLKEMEDVNPEFSYTDVSLVIGANDVTNPAARNSPDSPIYGMPILDVDKSQAIIVLKRSMNPGFAGIDNQLYTDPKTAMLFGDAKDSLMTVLGEVKEL
jgi:H+-translocating NAD(P) transhydrogenase subunit beta